MPLGLRFELTLPASVQPSPVDGRVFVVITRDGKTEPRLQFGKSGGQYRSAPFFGEDVDGVRARPDRGHRPAHGWLPARAPLRPSGRRVFRSRPAHGLHDVSPRRRTRRQAAHGSVGRPGLPALAREPVQRAQEDQTGSARRRNGAPVAGSQDSADPGAGGHGVRQAHSLREPAAVEVLGAPDSPRRDDPPAARLRPGDDLLPRPLRAGPLFDFRAGRVRRTFGADSRRHRA